MEQFILAYGNPADGFEYIGTFNSADEANEYAHIYAIGLDWWIIDLQKPCEEFFEDLEVQE